MLRKEHIYECPLLQALSDIESGSDDRAIGADGERSRFQIMEQTWISYDKFQHDFSKYASDPDVASKIAIKHLEFLTEHFQEETSIGPTPADLYIMWNIGFRGYKSRGFNPNRVSLTIRNRATRFNNLLLLHTSKN